MIFGLSWGVFLAYIIGLITVVLSLITAFSARDEEWNIEKVED